MSIHRFARWLARVVTKLSKPWNTRFVIRTKLGMEMSESIQFRRGLPQGDSLCPRRFTICLNPISWKLKANEGYRLSKPIDTKVTHLLCIEDLKIFATSAPKLKSEEVLCCTRQERSEDRGRRELNIRRGISDQVSRRGSSVYVSGRVGKTKKIR